MKKLLLFAFLIVICQKLTAQAGMLDTNFGENGLVTFSNNFISSALTPDGKLVAIRQTSSLSSEIIRYNSDGTVDLTFGTDGIVNSYSGAASIRVQGDGRMVIGGARYIANQSTGGLTGSNYFYTATYNIDGSPDSSKGGTTDNNGNFLPGVTLYSDNAERGRYEGLSIAAPANRAIIQYETASPGGSQAHRLILAEEARNFALVATPSLLRVNYFPTNPFSYLALQDGSLIVGGQETGFFFPQPAPGAPFPFTTRLLLNKFRNDFTLDPTFGNNGIVAFQDFKGIQSLVLQPDQKFIGLWNDSILRFNHNGSLDAAFGSNGVSTIDFNASTLLLQSNGKLIIGGTQNGDFALTRLNTNGEVDPTFGNNGLTITDLGEEAFIRELAIVGDRLFAYGITGDPYTSGTFENKGRLAVYNLNSMCTPTDFLNTLPIVGNATCGNNDGQISIIPTSGTAPFMYSLNGGTTYVEGPDAGYTRFNLSAGTYQLKLKDANGCESETIEKTVQSSDCQDCTQPTLLNTLPIVGHATCGVNDGQISIIPTSGLAPYMYSLDGGSNYVAGPDVGYTVFYLPAGTYRLRLKDANGCESEIIERTIESINCPTCTPPTFLNTMPIIGDATCGQSDGQISVIPTSGTEPFMFSIDGGATYVAGPNTGYTFFNLPSGTYQLRLKDMNGCESEIVERMIKDINCPNTSTNAGKGIPLDTWPDKKVIASTFPNPNKGQFRLHLLNFSGALAEVSVCDAKGTLVHKRRVSLAKGSTVDFDLSGTSPGMYYLKVVSGVQTSSVKIIIQK